MKTRTSTIILTMSALLASCIFCHSDSVEKKSLPVKTNIFNITDKGLMQDESVFFSNDVGNRSAQLLFKPEKIISVRPANGTDVYIAGKDYEVDLENGVIRLLPGSAIKSYNLLTNVLGDRRFKNRHRDGQPFFHGEGDFVHSKQCRVTYTYNGNSWKGKLCLPKPQVDKLPNITKRLRDKKPSSVLLVGDSISVGYNASGFVNAAPHLPAYGEQVAARLKKSTGSPVTFHNISKAGAGAGWGLGQMEKLTATNPDLAIIAFGMNDAGRLNHQGRNDGYEKNTRGLIEGLRKHNPKIDIILVANMLPNKAYNPNIVHFGNPTRLYKLAKEFDRVVVADVMAVTEEMLKRKKFSDISGNNLNHPNDFLHRIYAEVILTVMGR
jgi:lysophospholipase L1-like esterase